ncbi:MAG: hypothetical protein NTW14_14285 [bacterium]|nr:hypothetical protein [bacterium]
MKCKRISFGLVVCLALIALSASAYDKATEQALLGTVENPCGVSPIVFNPLPGATDEVTWTMMTPCPQNFQRSAIARLGNYVYLFGNYLAANFAQAFDITTGAWMASTPPTYTGENWVGVAANGSIYVFPTPFYSTHVQKFTPIAGGPTGTWTDVAPYPEEIGSQAVAWDGGNYIYCAGGLGPVANAYRYDIANNVFTPIAPLTQPRSFPGGAFLNGKFYVVGGMDDASQYTTNLYEYTPSTNTWAEKASAPAGTGFTCWATTYNTFYLFVVGGGGGYLTWPAVDACQVYDPASNTWFLDTARPLNNGTNEVTYVSGSNYLIDGGGYDGSQSYNVWWKGSNPPGGASPNAPAAPTNFTVSHNNIQLMATLNWTNPSLQVNGQPLTSLAGITIYRNASLVDTVTNVQIGQPFTYQDNVPSAGMYQYKLTPYNASGPGLDALASGWIGLDTPGQPGNVVATPDPNQLLICTVTWTAPTAGAHGGYWPPGSWTGQRIYRDTLMIAELTGSNTSYLDSSVPQNAYYTYGVAYYNASGEGSRVNAPLVMVGSPLFQQIPYNWVEINTIGTNTGLIGDDQNLGPFPIGFSFPFYDSNHFDSLRVCSNGFASFTSTVTAYTNAPIPTVDQPNNLLAIFWDDLQCNVAGAYVWYYHDTANSRFIIEWERVKKYGATGSSLTFEIILYPNGNVDYMYNTMSSTILNSATVGIENATGNAGIQVTYNGSGSINPSSNMGIRIFSVSQQTPPLTVTLTPLHPPIIIPRNGGSFQYNLNVHNLGTQVSTPTSPTSVLTRALSRTAATSPSRRTRRRTAVLGLPTTSAKATCLTSISSRLRLSSAWAAPIPTRLTQPPTSASHWRRQVTST